MVPVGCNWFLTSIYCFDWSKTSLKFFTLACFLIVDLCLLCLLDQRSLIMKLVLGCDWKTFVGSIKPYILICFPCRFVEVNGEIYGCVVTFFIINLLAGFEEIISRFWWQFFDSEELLVLESVKGSLIAIYFIPFKKIKAIISRFG